MVTIMHSGQLFQQSNIGTYEIYGHGGVGIILTTMTGNGNRVVKKVKSVMIKRGMKMANSGSVLFSFQHRGIIKRLPRNNKDFDENEIEDLEFLQTSYDGREGNEIEQRIIISTLPEHCTKLQDKIEEMGFLQISSSLEYLPLERVEIENEEVYEMNANAIEELENLSDADMVYHNMK